MSETRMFTPQEVAQAEQSMKMDMHIADICGHIAQLYKSNPPSAVYCFMNGNVRVELGVVSQGLLGILRQQLKDYILATYPPMEYLFAPVPVNSEEEWRNPKSDIPPKGEFWVITDTEYCIKAVHYGGNDWQSDGHDLKNVCWYRPVPGPPPGMHIAG